MGGSHKKAPEFLCNVKFKTTLTEPCIDSRMILIKPDLSRFSSYKVSLMEQNYQHPLPFDILKSPFLDTTDLSIFQPNASDYLAAEDEIFLYKGSGSGSKEPSVSKPAGKSSDVPWLRRTEYLVATGEPTVQMPKEEQNQNTPIKLEVEGQSNEEPKVMLESKQDVIEAIENSFRYAEECQKDRLVHPTNRNLTASAVYPIIPIIDGSESYSMCTFDADPSQSNIDGVEIADNGDEVSVIKAMSAADNPQDTFVWYYLPAKECDGDEDSRLIYARDYDIQRIENKSGGGCTFALNIPTKDGEVAEYVPISGHFQLRKRRAKSESSKHSLKIHRL